MFNTKVDLSDLAGTWVNKLALGQIGLHECIWVDLDLFHNPFPWNILLYWFDNHLFFRLLDLLYGSQISIRLALLGFLGLFHWFQLFRLQFFICKGIFLVFVCRSWLRLGTFLNGLLWFLLFDFHLRLALFN